MTNKSNNKLNNKIKQWRENGRLLVATDIVLFLTCVFVVIYDINHKKAEQTQTNMRGITVPVDQPQNQIMEHYSDSVKNVMGR